jgi:hypothetical protein
MAEKRKKYKDKNQCDFLPFLVPCGMVTFLRKHLKLLIKINLVLFFPQSSDSQVLLSQFAHL